VDYLAGTEERYPRVLQRGGCCEGEGGGKLG